MRVRVLCQRIVALTLGCLLVAPSLMPAATAQELPQAEDYCHGQCADILPPGQNGNATLADIAANQIFGARPKHSDDQVGKYDALRAGYSSLTTGTIQDFFNDHSFGVAADQIERSYQPRGDVTVVRDKRAGIPHIYGVTRAGTTFGAGYTTAEDKLFVMDVLRHAARGKLTPFVGGAPANRETEQAVFSAAPYTEQELQQQLDSVARRGDRGRVALEDAKSYVDGVNTYIQQAYQGRYFPGEYVVTGHVDAVTNEGAIEPFTLTDLVALAALIGGQFGGGGGGEVQNALAKMSLQEQFGPERGEQIWKTFRADNDPEAISTVHDGRSFSYGAAPEFARGAALPDKGTVADQQLVFDPQGSAAAQSASPLPEPPAKTPAAPHPMDLQEQLNAVKGMFRSGVAAQEMAQPHSMSNALVVSGAHTTSGHPVAVFGPQTGYYAPQMLTLQELQGPGISSKGASFAGLSFYTLLGRGQDYAWSATSAGQDIIDTYAVGLCEPDGRPATEDSNHYLFHGECVPFQTVERRNEWKPNLGDTTPPGSYRLVSYRTRYGPVTHRATIGGKPVAYTSARSTFLHEVDSIIGFQKFNDPAAITSARAFQQAANDVNYTFNWFYADSKDTAYFNSGANLIRKSDVDPGLPIVSDPAFEWQGWNPVDNTASYTPFTDHPNAINQDYLVSWNNKQAPGVANGQSAVHRGDLLDRRVKALTSAGRADRISLTQAMEDAGLTDARAERVLPELLRVVESKPVSDPTAREAVGKLKEWLAAGGKRTETQPGSKKYAHSEAIRLMDAWWPLLVRGEFEPALGTAAYEALTRTRPIDNPPNGGGAHRGSAYITGWYGQVSKDLRAVLGEPVAGGFPVPFCGNGELGACRQRVLDTLIQAAAVPADQTYPADKNCQAGDQWCFDSLIHAKLGGIGQDKLSWQNRPTYQQVVEFPAHR